MSKNLRQLSSLGPHPSRSLRHGEPDVIELFVTCVSQDRTVFLPIYKTGTPRDTLIRNMRAHATTRHNDDAKTWCGDFYCEQGELTDAQGDEDSACDVVRRAQEKLKYHIAFLRIVKLYYSYQFYKRLHFLIDLFINMTCTNYSSSWCSSFTFTTLLHFKDKATV